jgi:hypothetical protein
MKRVMSAPVFPELSDAGCDWQMDDTAFLVVFFGAELFGVASTHKPKGRERRDSS